MFELAGFKITDEVAQFLHKAAARNLLVLLIVDKTISSSSFPQAENPPLILSTPTQKQI